MSTGESVAADAKRNVGGLGPSQSQDSAPSVVRSRFAPSPTGFLHVGGVRTALFAWALAKQAGGQFILRIEDTDKARQVDGSIEHIIESLKWLGIDWQEGPDVGGEHGPYLQSQRLEIYKQWAQKLIESGHAYTDPYSKEEIAELRTKAQEAKKPFLYREHRPEKLETVDDWYGKLSLRFKTPVIKRYTWQDEVRGELSAGEEALDDFVLIKADGYPTYNFAHVVDDHLMDITHVIRGEEFISSMPKFLSLHEALELDLPKYVTAPPILNPNGGKKLSKRDGAKDILEYRDDGYTPEAVLNFLVSLGWNDGTDMEIYSPEQFVSKFSVERVQRSGAKFDPSKLDWIQWQHVLKHIDDQNFDSVMALLPDDCSKNSDLIVLAATKSNSIDTLATQLKPANTSQEAMAELLKAATNDTKLDTDSAKQYLDEIVATVENSDFTCADLEEKLRAKMAELEAKPRQFLGLTRWIISQNKVSPSLFELMEVLGREESMKRLRAALD